jgi:hypothetical protein
MSGDTKDYNIMSEYGVKDSDYVKEFGMPEELAGTGGINDWLINKVYEDNLREETTANLQNGMDSKEAIQLATRIAKEGKEEAKRNVLKVKKIRGY